MSKDFKIFHANSLTSYQNNAQEKATLEVARKLFLNAAKMSTNDRKLNEQIKKYNKAFAKMDENNLKEKDIELMEEIIEQWGSKEMVANAKKRIFDESSAKEITGLKRSLAEFKKSISETGSINNEIIKKNSLQPHHIKGFVVDSEEEKHELITALEKAGRVIIVDPDGKKTINNIEVDKFFHVSRKFTEEMWA